MGYYVRVLGIRDDPVSVEKIRTAISESGVQATVECDGENLKWQVIDITHADDGPGIMQVERNPVVEGELGAEELQEFIEEVLDCKPESGAKWLQSYLPKVKVIFAMRLLGGTDIKDGWSVVSGVQQAIWSQVGGILQADNEGFSNEEGSHILWQFSDDVRGPWKMAVRWRLGMWKSFVMELSNSEHRNAFLAGKVPKDVKATVQ